MTHGAGLHGTSLFTHNMEKRMKTLSSLLLVSVLASLPGLAVAQSVAVTKGGDAHDCPQVDASAMRKDMGAMMTDMTGMMARTSDPSQKARMQMMHDHMATMMVSMQKMNDGMMGGSMMQGGGMQGKKVPQATPAPAKPDDHAAHHPGN
jgi:hypothetical protein